MIQQLGLFGYPLSHSISPAFQQAALDYHCLNVRYHSWPTTPNNLSDGINILRGHEYLGANVTVPHKETVLSLLDHVDPSATEIGAVNTIVKDGQRLLGFNTDTTGFLRSLHDEAGFEAKGMSVLLIGAGGAARAASFCLGEQKISSLTISNRTIERAMLLAKHLSKFSLNVDVISMGKCELAKAASGANLIINATSMGLANSPEQGLTPLYADMIPSNTLVYDMVYNPIDTPLLIEAQKVGARAMGGLAMLVYQGAASFELWTRRKAPTEVMFRSAEKAMASFN